jgi:hypothetical protein
MLLKAFSRGTDPSATPPKSFPQALSALRKEVQQLPELGRRRVDTKKPQQEPRRK